MPRSQAPEGWRGAGPRKLSEKDQDGYIPQVFVQLTEKISGISVLGWCASRVGRCSSRFSAGLIFWGPVMTPGTICSQEKPGWQAGESDQSVLAYLSPTSHVLAIRQSRLPQGGAFDGTKSTPSHRSARISLLFRASIFQFNDQLQTSITFQGLIKNGLGR